MGLRTPPGPRFNTWVQMQDRHPILRPLPVPHRQFVTREARILHPELQTLQEPQASPTEQRHHEPPLIGERVEHPLHLGPTRDHRQPPRTTRTHQVPSSRPKTLRYKKSNADSACVCVDAATPSVTARSVRNALSSGSPIVSGGRSP